MMPIALALASAAFYGAADFIGAITTRRSSALAATLASQGAGVAVLFLALALLPAAQARPVDYLWGAGAGLTGGLGLGLLYRALATGVMSVVAPITALCAATLPVAVGLALGERPGARVLGGVALAIVAIVLVSQEGEVEGARAMSRGAVAIALVSGVAFGLFYVCLSRTGREAGLWPLVAARSVSVGGAFLLGTATRVPLLPPRPALPLSLFGGAMDMVANIFYVLAARTGMLTVVAVLASLYPGSTVLLAHLLLGERLRRVQRAGLACAAVAVALISAG